MRKAGEPLVKHGFCTRKKDKSKFRLFTTWQSMLWRCFCKTNSQYKHYGARGITVCGRWRKSFQNFLNDMGLPPQGTTLGRIDNDGNYKPSNCRWETIYQQANNKRSTRLVSFGGKTQSVAQWAREVKLPKDRLLQRLDRGWTVSDALSRPRRIQCNNAEV